MFVVTSSVIAQPDMADGSDEGIVPNFKVRYFFPEPEKTFVQDFFDALDPIQDSLNSRAIPSQSQLANATEKLRRFRPNWEVRISKPLGPKDRMPTAVELYGPKEGFMLSRDPATGGPRANPVHGSEVKFFLWRQREHVWEIDDTYFDYIHRYRSPTWQMWIDVETGKALAMWSFSLQSLFPSAANSRDRQWLRPGDHDWTPDWTPMNLGR